MFHVAYYTIAMSFHLDHLIYSSNRLMGYVFYVSVEEATEVKSICYVVA